MPKITYHFRIMQLKKDESLYRDFLFMKYYRARSLSVSDIVSLVADKEASDKEPVLEHYYVDSVGFKKLEVSA